MNSSKLASLPTRDGSSSAVAEAHSADASNVPAIPAFAVTGTYVGVSAEGMALVDLPASPHLLPLRARSCVDLVQSDIGKEVVLVFEDGDRRRPLIIGTLRTGRPLHSPCLDASQTAIEVDGQSVTLTGQESVTLRCGAASITLRSDGRITIRGAELESRASGLHRIQGASVRIN